MNKKLLTEIGLHAAIILSFVLISLVYFYPIMEGKQIPQMDNIHAKGMSHELVEFDKQHPNEESLWTNSMFGGMPAYQIKNGTSRNVFTYLHRIMRFGLPYTTVAILFTYLLGFYILLISLGFSKWLSVIGSIAFAFASYNLIIIDAGHITKTYAIAYMAPTIAGFILIFRKKYWLGSLITLFFLGLEIASNHPQITYYLALSILIFIIVELVYAIRKKEINHFIKASVFALVASLLAVAPGIRDLWTTYEYGKESIRGKTELTAKEGTKVSSGLDKDYALAWSYGKAESFTVLIPNFVGGGTNRLDQNSETYKNLVKKGLPPQTAQAIIRSTGTYWGPMPFTSGPVYFGAIVILLFVFGLFVLKGPEKWWLVTATILSFLLAWGKNFEWFTDLFFYYFPLYNKFRTVSMILVVANVTTVLMASLALKSLFDKTVSKAQLKKALLYSTSIVGGLILFFILFGGALMNFTGINDSYIIDQLARAGIPQEFIRVYSEGLHTDRAALMRVDAFRSLMFVLMAAGALWLFIAKKLKKEYFLIAIGVLILIDLWVIDRRYLNKDDFVNKRKVAAQFQKTPSDEVILKDVDPDFRVLNLTRSVFNDAYTPYFHKSIGGYHGAKLRRYQDLIDHRLTKEISNLQQVLSKKGVQYNQIDSVLNQSPSLNMLNGKYVIYSAKGYTINMNALGHVWFVPSIKWVNNADEEIAALDSINPKYIAVIDKRFKSDMGNFKADDSLSTANLIDMAANGYKPNHLTYQTNTKKEEFAVFSEIYYDKGWNAYIDNKPAKIVRVDYVLRGMVIPAGKHLVEMKFEPKSYATGNTISLVASILVVLIILGGIFMSVKEAKKE